MRKLWNDWSLLGVGRGPYLPSLRLSDAGVTEVTTLPFRVEAVSLELPELKGGMKGTGLHFDRDRVDPDRHPLNHLLRKAIFTENTNGQHKQINVHRSARPKMSAGPPYLWPAVMAIGEGPFGGRGSSHVLISTSTLSKNWAKTHQKCLRTPVWENNASNQFCGSTIFFVNQSYCISTVAWKILPDKLGLSLILSIVSKGRGEQSQTLAAFCIILCVAGIGCYSYMTQEIPEKRCVMLDTGLQQQMNTWKNLG